eukprot:2000563-Prymnesium_polylepis.1
MNHAAHTKQEKRATKRAPAVKCTKGGSDGAAPASGYRKAVRAVFRTAEPRGDGGVASARSQLTMIDSAWGTCDAQNQSVRRNPPPSGGLARTAE